MAFIAGNVDASPVVLNLGVDFTEDLFAFLKGEEVFYFGVFIVFDCVDELFVCSFLFVPPFLQVLNLLLTILLLLVMILAVLADVLDLPELLLVTLCCLFLFPFGGKYFPHPWRWRKVLDILLVVLVAQLVTVEAFFHLR